MNDKVCWSTIEANEMATFAKMIREEWRVARQLQRDASDLCDAEGWWSPNVEEAWAAYLLAEARALSADPNRKFDPGPF